MDTTTLNVRDGSGWTAAQDLEVNLPNMEAALSAVSERASAGKGYTLFTANLDHLAKVQHDSRFGEAYHRADFVTADGWPIVWNLNRGGHKLERTTGADLLEPMCRQAARDGLPMYFVGPGAESQAVAIDRLTRRIPTLIVVGKEAPRFAERLNDEQVAALAKRINASGAKLCVISLGAPKQEILADMLLKLCPDVGFLCFGAALDFMSGHAKRAPAWMRKLGLEWAWRLAQAPRRMFVRYARCALTMASLAAPGLFPDAPRVRLGAVSPVITA